MIPPEPSGASRTKVAWCNLGGPALESACRATVRAITPARPGGPPRVRRAPSPPPIGHDSPPAPPRAVTSRRPDPDQPTPCDHSRPDRRHVLTTHGTPRSHQLPLAAPPGDSSCDLGGTHAARRATSPPRLEARPASAPPRAPADRSRRTARPTPSGHVPSAGPQPTDDPRPLDAPHAARPDHSRTPRSHQLPLAAPPRDSSCDLGEAHAARRATGAIPRTRQLPREEREER